MKEYLVFATEQAIVVIDAIALVLVLVGTVEALIGTAKLIFGERSGHLRRDVWLRYARWLVGALTFQLAADIIESSITTSWEAIARLAAIALIRTFLNYFLERDLAETREREREAMAGGERSALQP
jgi:uncharacterized membrane protein